MCSGVVRGLVQQQLLAAIVLILMPAGSGCPNGPGDGGKDGQADVNLLDGDVLDVEVSDASVDSGPTPCEEDVIVPLPPRGDTIVSNYGISGSYVLYLEWRTPGQEFLHDVFVFDLVACEEIPVAVYEKAQLLGRIHGTEVVWTDSRFNTGQPDDYRAELYSYDLLTGVETRLTDSPQQKGVMGLHGDRIVYYFADETIPDGTFQLWLWDRATGDHVLLADHWEGAEGVGISDQYITWGAYGASSKDVYIHDLQTGDTTMLEQPGSQYVTATAGDYLIFMTEETSSLYHVDLYRYSTGQVTRLDNNDFSRMNPSLQGNLAVWVDYGYSQETFGGLRDLVVYDLETGALRRATTESDIYVAGFLDHDGWLLYSLPGSGQFKYALYTMNLYRAGVLDELGHVIPE